MKALAVSEDRTHLNTLRQMLGGAEAVLELSTQAGLIGSAPLPIDVGLMIVDCRHEPVSVLAALERVMAQAPGLAVVLVVEEQRPEVLLAALRLGVREVVSVPLVADEMRAAVARIVQRARGAARGEGRVLSFVSCKGGSGVSFLAANLGHALAAGSAGRVLLIDLDLQFGDCALYVSERRAAVTLAELARDISRVDMSLLKSALIEVLPNFSVLAAPADATAASDIRPLHIESLIRFARGHFDYVLLDLGSGLNPCSMSALELSDHIYPVLQLSLPYVRAGRQLFEVCARLGLGPEKVRPIINRFEKNGAALGVAEAEKWLQYKVFASVPNHYKSVAASINQGVPILQLDASSVVARSVRELAQRLGGVEPARRAGLWAGLMAQLRHNKVGHHAA